MKNNVTVNVSQGTGRKKRWEIVEEHIRSGGRVVKAYRRKISPIRGYHGFKLAPKAIAKSPFKNQLTQLTQLAAAIGLKEFTISAKFRE